MPEVELVGVVDINAERVAEVAHRLKTRPYEDHRQLLGRVDAVSVVTTTTDHFAVSRDFLSQGVDVLIEKPMTTTLQEADELIKLAHAQNRDHSGRASGTVQSCSDRAAGGR